MASAYPRWAETCFSPRLQTLIRERSACAGHRADALGLILPGLGENTMTGCRVASILEEGGRYLDVEPETDPGVLDAALGSAVYALCHCMICSYHCARNSASLLNLREAFALQKFLLEEQRLESAIKRLVEETLSPEALQTPGFAAHQLNQMRKAP